MPSSPIRVTIITPTYNHARFIRQCIESVLGQTMPDWEQIIVDDCSSDKTAEIARSYNDPRIRIIANQKRNGIEQLNDTYNQALAVAKGEFVAVLEGDDYWPLEKLSRQLPAFENESVVLSWGRMVQDDDNRIVVNPSGTNAIPWQDFATSTEWLLVRNDIGAVTVMVRKSALDKIGGFYQVPGTVMVDYSTWLLLSTIGEFRYVTFGAGYWRRHPGQITQVKRRLLLRSQLEIVQDFLRRGHDQNGGKPFNLRYCKAGIAFREGQLEHMNGNNLRAARHYLAALPGIHAIERLQVFKSLVKALIFRSVEF